jgi:hypothetical protein
MEEIGRAYEELSTLSDSGCTSRSSESLRMCHEMFKGCKVNDCGLGIDDGAGRGRIIF